MLVSHMTAVELLAYLATEPERQAAILQAWEQDEKARRNTQEQAAIRQHECELRVLHEIGRIEDLLSLASRKPSDRSAAIIQALQILETLEAFMLAELRAQDLITDDELGFLVDAQWDLDDLMGKYGSLIYYFNEDQGLWYALGMSIDEIDEEYHEWPEEEEEDNFGRWLRGTEDDFNLLIREMDPTFGRPPMY